MFRYKICPLTLGLIITLGVWANPIRVDSFSSADGLVDFTVTAIGIDANDYLWVGGPSGVSRFNGQTFTDTVDIPNAPTGGITDILNIDDQVWMISPDKVHRYDGQSFHLVYESETRIRCHLVDDKALLIGAGSQLIRLTADGQEILAGEEWENNISVIHRDTKGDLWVGLRYQGVARQGADGWQLFGTERGLPNGTVNDLLTDRQGRLWVATLRGLAYREGDIFIPAPFNGDLRIPIVYQIREDEAGDLWFNPSRGGIYRWNGAELTAYDAERGLPSELVSTIHPDEAGRMWALTGRGAVYIEDGQVFSVDIPRETINTFLEADDGLIWLGGPQGLYRCESLAVETFLRDPTSEFMAFASQTRRIFKDSRDDLWFPSIQGLGYYAYGKFRLFTAADGLPGSIIHRIFESEGGRIWVGGDEGVAYFEDGRWVRFHPEWNRVISLLTDGQNRLWVLNEALEIWRADAAASREDINFTKQTALDGLRILLRGRDGQVLAITNVGIHVFSGDDAPVLYPTPNTLNIQLAYTQDKLWFTPGIGLYHFDMDRRVSSDNLLSESEAAEKNIVDIELGDEGELWLQVSEGLPFSPSNFVVKLMHYQDGDTDWVKIGGRHMEWFRKDRRGNHWVGSRRDLFQVTEDGFRQRIDGNLLGSRPVEILWDDEDHLWVATDSGINKVDLERDLIAALSTNQGLLAVDITDIELDKQGGLWIRTREGVQRFNERRKGPRLRISSITTGSDQSLPVTTDMKLAHHQNTLIFDLEAVYLHHGAEELQYMVELISNGQVQQRLRTGENRLYFPSLRPGEYQLKVTAYNRDLNAGQMPIDFTFQIIPPLWQRPEFILVVIVVAILLGWVLYRHRMRGNLEKARVLNELHAAQRMQMSLLPKSAPKLDEFELFGACVPAREVGGDFFDYFWLDDSKQKLGFAIMDVSGKSMEAAIISVMSSGLVYGEHGRGHPPADIMRRINYPTYLKTDRKTFITGLVGSVERDKARLSWANAGHIDPIFIRKGKQFILPQPAKRDLPLGAVKDWRFEEFSVDLEPGDMVLVYTDGLNEATDEANQLFGDERIIRYLERHHASSPSAMTHGLLDLVREFVGEAPQHDDITLIAIRYNGSRETAEPETEAPATGSA